MLRPVGCLTLEMLTELFEASLAERSRSRSAGVQLSTEVDLHLDACESCRELVAAYARATDDSGDAADLAGTAFARTVSSVSPAAGAEVGAGDLVAARYMLLRQVGEGGMGVVWAAKDTFHDREVALKILKDASPELAGRSMREARAATCVGHPALLEVLDVVPPPSPGRAPILVMPLLSGRSLGSLLRERGKLPWREMVALMVPVLDGMRAAHARGVIHRDLKPENVFLAESPPDPPVTMVLDFGLSKLLSPDGTDASADKLTRTGAVLGTPHYMAPEQLFGDSSVDGRADVWAIGAIAYECLSGAQPVPGKSYAQIVRNAAKGSITSLHQLCPDAPAALAASIMSMLIADREQRPALDLALATWSALLSVA
jgi:serine/threonine protein kinase